MKKFLTLFLLVALSITQCFSSATVPVYGSETASVKTIKLNKKSIKLDKGKYFQLKTSITPRQAKKAKCIWKSNHPNIVSVTQKGKLKAKKSGKAKITVTVKGTKKQASCTVKVLTPVSKLTVSPTQTTISVGQKVPLKANITPKNASYKKITYRSANKKIATVTAKHNIKGIKEGKTTITVQVQGTTKKRIVSVTVKKKQTASPSAGSATPSEPLQYPSDVSSAVSVSKPQSSLEPAESDPSKVGTSSGSKVSEIDRQSESTPVRPSRAPEISQPIPDTPALPSTVIHPTDPAITSKPDSSATSQGSQGESSSGNSPSGDFSPSKEELPSKEVLPSKEDLPSKEIDADSSKASVPQTSAPWQPSKLNGSGFTSDPGNDTSILQPSETPSVSPSNGSDSTQNPGSRVSALTSLPSNGVSVPSTSTVPASVPSAGSLPYLPGNNLFPSQPNTAAETLQDTIQTVENMQKDMADETERTKVSALLDQARAATDETTQAMEQKKLQDWIATWEGAVTLAVYCGNETIAFHPEKEDDGTRTVSYLIRQDTQERIVYTTPKAKDSRIELKNTEDSFYTQEVIVTAKNSYTVHYRIHQTVLAGTDNILEIQSVESERDPVLAWETSFLGVEDNALVYALDLSTASLEDWTEDLTVVSTQNNADIRYETCNQNGYAKKILLSAPGARTTIYYVRANHCEQWDLAQLKVDGQICENITLEKSEENGQNVWDLSMPMPQHRELEVIPKYPQVKASVEASDRPEYEQKVVLQYKDIAQTAYLSFQDSGLEEPGILNLYQNGKQVVWQQQKQILDGTPITELLLDSYQTGDDLQVVPYTDSTTVDIKDSTRDGYEKELTLSDGGKSRTYYIAASNDADPLSSTLEQIIVDHQVYVAKGQAESTPYFFCDPVKKELLLYGEKKPLDWQTMTFQFSDKDWKGTVTTSETYGCDANVTFTNQERSEIYTVKWMLSNEVWDITAVKANGNRKEFSYTLDEDVIYDEQIYDPSGKKLLVYDIDPQTSVLTVIPKHPATKAVVNGTQLTLTYTDGTERYIRQIPIRTEKQSRPKETDETWQIQSLQIGEERYTNQEDAQESELPDTYFEQEEESLALFGLQKEPSGTVQVTMKQKNGAAVTVLQNGESVDGGYLCLDYQGKKKYLQIHYQLNPSVWDIQTIKMDQTDATFSISENEITIYTKTAELGTNIQIQPIKKDVSVQEVTECRIGNAQRKVAFSYKDHIKTFYIKTEFPTEEEKDPFQKINEFFIGSQKFVVKQGDVDHYFAYYGNHIFLYGTKDWTDDQLTGPEAPEWKVTSQIAGARVTVEDTAQKGYLKRITIQYKGYLQVYYAAYDFAPSVWNMKKIQTKAQSYTVDQTKKTGYIDPVMDYRTNEQSIEWITTEKSPEIQSVLCENTATTCSQEDITYDTEGIPVSILLHHGTRTKRIRLHPTLPQSYWEITAIKTAEKTYNNDTDADCIENSDTGCRWSVSEKAPRILSVTTDAGNFSLEEKDILYKNDIPCGLNIQYGIFQKYLPIQCNLSSDMSQVASLQTNTGVTYQAQKEDGTQEAGTFLQEANMLYLIGTETDMPQITSVKMKHEEVICDPDNIEWDEQGYPQALFVCYGIFRERVDLYYENADEE